MTNENDPFGFAALENLDDLRAPARNPHRAIATERKTFPCMSCAGTGKWQPARRGAYIVGRENSRGESKCFACKGTGSHTKPHAEAVREKAQAKAKREQGARNAQANRREAFEAANPGLLAWMFRQEWSAFLQEMARNVDTPRGLTDGQLAAVLNTKAKQEARRAEKAAEKAAGAVTVSLATIETMFNAAREKGLKKLAYRAHGLVVSPAAATGKNPGAIYVKTSGGEYLGKVTGGKFLATSAASDTQKAALLAIAADPAGEARQYGKETGICCCCGRELTDKNSIEAGIGPVCADKWGF